MTSMEVNDNPPNQKLPWTELRKIIRSSRAWQTSVSSQVPHSFCFRTFYTEYRTVKFVRLYCLTNIDGNRENTICYYDIKAGGVVTECNRLLGAGVPSKATLSKEEQLLRERKRMSHSGITSYDVDVTSGWFVFPAAGSLYRFQDRAEGVIVPDEMVTSSRGPRLDPKLCPFNTDLVAFVQSDLWVAHREGSERRLTNVSKGSRRLEDDPYSAGIPSFIVQEEFDRYTGYWWQPNSDDGVYRILFEEVDESRVGIVTIMSDTQETDEYRYPAAGTPNASSQLKIAEFRLDSSNQISDICIRELSRDLEQILPETEYLVRAGWTPDGRYVWLQVLNRCQSHLRLVLIPLSSFAPPSDEMEPPTPVEYCTIYEDRSDVWINVTDILYFLRETSDEEISFIWASEQTGFLHLYKITSRLRFSNDQAEIVQQVALTQGNWEVNNKEIWVSEDKDTIYFMGLKDTPLETHLYYTSLRNPGHIHRLTQLGSSYNVEVDVENDLFVSVESNVSVTPGCHIYLIRHHDNSLFAKRCHTLLKSTTPNAGYVVPELFSFVNSENIDIHGMVYRPNKCQPGRKYPTVLFVYGGPQVQLVTNSYKSSKLHRLHTLANLGYAVVVIDGRGSYHRGLKFEGHIKHKMGTVEIADQVEGLEYAARCMPYIDMKRVAIHGWSYGGYMSLLGLIQRPDIFKVAIAGAPVTHWDLYDTGYSERYMSTPQLNKDGYHKGSILLRADQFPNEEHRLMLIHGLIDENVHFTHTKMLCDALIRHCKPFDIKIYPSERHGIRSLKANEHYDASVMGFLQDYL